MNFLQSERLYFRRYERGDVDFLAGLFSDPEVMRFIGTGVVLDRAAAVKRIEGWRESQPDRGFFLALTRVGNVPVGHAALVIQDVEGRQEPEVGWWLARSAWGMGYATEAGAAFRDYAFTRAGLDRVIHLIAPGNTRSIAVATRIGSKYERSAVFRGNPVAIFSQQRAAPWVGGQTKRNVIVAHEQENYGSHEDISDQR